jgi:hypothetical protein
MRGGVWVITPILRPNIDTIEEALTWVKQRKVSSK